MIFKSPISICMKEKPTEAKVSWQPLSTALEVWMLVEVNFREAPLHFILRALSPHTASKNGELHHNLYLYLLLSLA